MYVRDTMTVNPYCINKDTKVSVALDIMNQNEFHRLPVVDSKGKLIGLITEVLLLKVLLVKLQVYLYMNLIIYFLRLQ